MNDWEWIINVHKDDFDKVNKNDKYEYKVGEPRSIHDINPKSPTLEEIKTSDYVGIYRRLKE